MFNKSFFTPEEFPAVCKTLQALTGYDINNAALASGGRNVTYIISNHIRPAAIRISPINKTREEVLSELLFVDYLREHIHTICQPNPINNSLVNELEICGKPYYIVLFRKANGISPWEEDNTEHIYALMGAKLAELHNASKRATLENFTFQRKCFDKLACFDFNNPALTEVYPADIIQHMQQSYAAVTNLKRSQENFGMIHGDFHQGNIFADWDDIWVFDFDDCHYGFFLYDIVTALVSPLMGAFMSSPLLSTQTARKLCQAFYQGYSAISPATAPLFNKETLAPFVQLRLTALLNTFTHSAMPADITQHFSAVAIDTLRADFSALL